MRSLALVLLLLASSVFGQVAGVCGNGKNCTMQSITLTKQSNQLCLRGPTNDLLLTNTSGGHLWQLCTANTSCASGCSNYIQNLPTAMNFIAGASVSAPSGVMNGGTGITTGATGTGTAFASFPAAASSTGRWLYDSTNGYWRFSDGTVWAAPLRFDVFYWQAYFPGQPATLNVATSQWSLPSTTQNNNVVVTGSSSYATPLIVGVGAGNAVWTLYDVTGAAATSTTCTVACTATVGTALTCSGTSSLVAGNVHQLRLTANACGTLPAVNFTLRGVQFQNN